MVVDGDGSIETIPELSTFSSVVSVLIISTAGALPIGDETDGALVED
jgi:hypothetical protein